MPSASSGSSKSSSSSGSSSSSSSSSSSKSSSNSSSSSSSESESTVSTDVRNKRKHSSNKKESVKDDAGKIDVGSQAKYPLNQNESVKDDAGEIDEFKDDENELRNDDHGASANEDKEGGIVETTSKAHNEDEKNDNDEDQFVQTSKNEDEKNDNDEDEFAGSVPDEIAVAMLELGQPMAINDETVFDPYPKVHKDAPHDLAYEHHEYMIVQNSRRALYVQFPEMKTAFGEFHDRN
jgi:hypothetical protein